jgi:hypothetical protein
MKKIIITIALAGMMGTAFGQGVVAFVNAGATSVYTNTTQTIWGTTLVGNTPASGYTATTVNGGSFYYALLMQSYSGSGATKSTTYTSLVANGWLSTGIIGAPGLIAGRIAGGNPVTTLSQDTIAVDNQYVVLGWSGNVTNGTAAGLAYVESTLSLGSTALWTLFPGVNPNTPGFVGLSNVGTGLGAVSPVQLLFGGAGQITGFLNLYEVPVPEPATFALAGLGGLSLLLFRRRK